MNPTDPCCLAGKSRSFSSCLFFIAKRTTPSINEYTRARADLRHKYTAACIEIFGTSDQ